MKKRIACLWVTPVVLLCVGLISSGCGTMHRQGDSMAAYERDKQIAERIKTAFFSDPAVTGTQVEISVLNGIVQLNGFVDTPEEKERAGQIASATPGVVEVKNQLLLPTGRPEEAPRL